MSFNPSSARLLSWSKKPLSATQTGAFLLLLSAGATAALLPPQTRTRLTQPLAHLTQATVHLAESTALRVPILRDAVGHSDSTAPQFLLASAPTKGKGTRAVTLVVNSTGDADDATPGDGVCQIASAAGASCTLRAAITEANASGGGTINFNIPGAGVHTIAPATQLPNISKPVTINGYTQSGSSQNTLASGDNAKILIELNVANASGAGAGLGLIAGSAGSTIRGLAVNNVPNGAGIVMASDNNTIQGCFVGTDATGTIARGSVVNGIAIAAANSNLIGGAAAGARNLIAANGIKPNQDSEGKYRPNIFIYQGSSSNTIQNNYIGTDPTGTKALDGGNGIQLLTVSSDGTNSTDNVIVGNLISGNSVTAGFSGIDIDGAKALNTVIQGNKIGTDVTGTKALGNGGTGIVLSQSTKTTVGGTVSGQGNLISGNKGGGIFLLGSGADSNTIQGNLIGTNAAGTGALGNGTNGLGLSLASNNVIGGSAAGARNVISGNGIANSNPGVFLVNGSQKNTFENNYIGTDITGTKAIGNGGSGVQLYGVSGAGTTASPNNVLINNVISGNGSTTYVGVEVDGAQVLNTTFQGNKIGTDATGTAAIANGGGGLYFNGSSNNTIGGSSAGQGNLISGNSGVGLTLSAGSNNNTVLGNFIGTNAAGTAALGNGTNGLAIVSSGNNFVGDGSPGGRNIVSGNGVAGKVPGILIEMSATGVNPNTITSNYVGTNATGTAAIGNGGSGIQIFSSSGDATATTGTGVTGNLLSGNGNYGIDIDGPKTTGTLVQANKIGTDASGTKAIANGLAGVQILGATGNTIGGVAADFAAGNLISGNKSAGVALSTGANSNTVQGNLIGTDASGLKALGNGLIGVGANNASNNTISGNTITSATTDGIIITGASSTGTIIQSNNIGVGSDGTTPLGNKGDGILFSGAAPGHTVGTPIVRAQAVHTKVTAGNLGNIIANNGGAGVSIELATAQACHRKSILGNSIYNNGGLGIDLNGDGVTANQPSSNQGDSTSGPNALQNYPILTGTPVASGGNATISGSLTSAPNASFTIQFFSSPTADPSGHGEGKTYLGSQTVTTNGSGTVTFTATVPDTTADTFFSATATDAVGNTSEFSTTATGTVIGTTPTPGPTATPTATATPRPTATATPKPTATATPKPTNTPGPTATPGPTSTPTPRPTATATPKPTSTPRPTSTPAPTATPLPSLAINDVSVTEGNSGTKNAVFTVTLSGTVNSPVSVHYATSNGTATAGSDYTATSGTLNFSFDDAPRGKTTRALTQTISVPVKGDTTREADETFFVTLSGATGATISRSQGTGTILNDDTAADLSVTQSVSSATVSTGSLVTFTLTVRNNGPDTSPGVVLTDDLPAGATFVSSSPTPTSLGEGTLTFDLGSLANGATKTVSVQVRAPGSATTLSNSATVAESGTPDPTAGNNGSTASVGVTVGAPAYSFALGNIINVGPYSPSLYHSGSHLVQNITITNSGTAPSGSPLLLALNGLPSSVTLVNASGSLQGTPYVTLPGALAVGQSTTIRLEYRLRSSDKPTFSPQIVDGTQSF